MQNEALVALGLIAGLDLGKKINEFGTVPVFKRENSWRDDFNQVCVRELQTVFSGFQCLLRRTLSGPTWCRCFTSCCQTRKVPQRSSTTPWSSFVPSWVQVSITNKKDLIKRRNLIDQISKVSPLPLSEPLHKEVQNLAFIDVVSKLRAHENKTVSHQASLTEQRLTAQS